MPPEVCVTQANAPPAKIKTNPIIASVHLRCMAALPVLSRYRPDHCCAGCVLISRESVSESKGRASEARCTLRAVQLGWFEKFRQAEYAADIASAASHVG